MENEQQDNIYNGLFIKKDGLLVPESSGDKAMFNNFVESLKEGQTIQVFFEANKDDGTNNQLAKIHVCIRKLAQEIGYDFEDMKIIVKQRSGLISGKHVKSFANCSKEELGLVIETINDIGAAVNIKF